MHCECDAVQQGDISTSVAHSDSMKSAHRDSKQLVTY